MTTDSGDLVLDPKCGSGTTAYVAELRILNKELSRNYALENLPDAPRI